MTDLPEQSEQTDSLTVPESVRDVAERAAEKTQAGGLKESTRDLYERRLDRWAEWCGEKDVSPIDPPPEVVATFLEDILTQGNLSASTLETYAAAITWAHEREGVESPAQSLLVRRYMKQVRSDDAARPKRQARPLYSEQIREMILAIPQDSLTDLRDRALLLVGFVGALRRSELVAIDRAHLRTRQHGYLLWVPVQKNDPEGQGMWKGIPKTGRRTCPFGALTTWLSALYQRDITDGAVFRSIDRWDNVRSHLSPDAVRRILKRRVEEAGYDPDLYSPHSLRAGFITQASESGAAASQVQRQTGHASYDTMETYIRSGDALDNTALKALGV